MDLFMVRAIKIRFVDLETKLKSLNLNLHRFLRATMVVTKESVTNIIRRHMANNSSTNPVVNYQQRVR